MKLLALLGSTLTSTRELAYGQTMPDAKDATLEPTVNLYNFQLAAFYFIHVYFTEKLKDGFTCPKEQKTDEAGQSVAHPKYAHPTDCQRFYVCLNGVEPRDLGCQAGEVYNEETERCDAPENVPGW